MKKLLLLLISVSLIFGCASAAYKRSLKDLPDADFTVEIPNGWWKPENINKYLITKDGAYQQYVLIQRRPIDRPFRHTRKTLNEGMLPLESAGIIVDEIASDRNIINFKVLENAPAVIDGHKGFKLLFTYANKKGTTFKWKVAAVIPVSTLFTPTRVNQIFAPAACVLFPVPSTPRITPVRRIDAGPSGVTV